MKPKEDKNPKTNLEKELDSLGDMMDAVLAKGDDEYYEAAMSNRERQNNEERVTKRPRKKGKRI